MQPTERERYVEVCCVVCAAEADKPYWDCGEYGFVRCSRCGHVYQNPQPSFQDLEARYADAYFTYELENDELFFDLMIKGLSDIGFEQRVAALAPRSFLDIGCATGMLPAYFAQRGFSAEGVELCEPAARYGREQRGVPIFNGTLEQAAFSDGRFGVVHASHLIEHLRDPLAFLQECRRIIAPNGYLVLVTPDTHGLQARLFGSRWRSAIADHLHLFGRRNLCQLLSDCGFTVEEQRSWGGLAAGIAPRLVKSPIDKAAKRWNFGDVMLLLARPVSNTST
ncbi:MAG: class I SAM-dependent methyltransferase [Spirochaetaceae bacterium]|nr:MAG: class I SAM-dependent methyltransferase [Spirochaetaceae bacterium]